MHKYFISTLVFFLCGILVFAQEKEELKIDTIKNKFLPTGLRVGLDVIPLIRSRDSSFKGWEVNVDTDFSQYYFTVDYGYWATNQPLDNGTYQNDGNYLRIGADINILLKDPDKNMFFFGFRYGMSAFSESLQYQYKPNYAGFGNVSTDLSNESLTGRWLEITAGLRVKIVSGFWMGYTARFKFAPSVSGGGTLVPYDMPGYGIIAEDPYWGFNYQLFWRFGWKKSKKNVN